MAAPALRPRSATEIVDAAFQILRAHYGQLVMATALAYVPLLVVRFVVIGDPMRFLRTMEAGDASTTMLWTTGIGMLATWLTLSVMDAVLIVCTSQAYLGEEVDTARAVRHALPRVPAVMFAALLRYVMMTMAFFAFVFPILYVVARYFAVTSTLVLENAGLAGAFRRSSVLSKGRKWHVLNTLGLVALIYWVLVIGCTTVAAVYGGFVVRTLVSALVTIGAYPAIAITETLLYYDARIQSEGLDIELMTDALEPAPALTGH